MGDEAGNIEIIYDDKHGVEVLTVDTFVSYYLIKT